MKTQIKHLTSGVVYKDRKEAKQEMGHSNFNRALKNGEIVFVTTYATFDTII